MKGKITWQGIAFIEFITADNKIVLFDPWTKTDGNPTCPYETDHFKQVDLILVSHDHFDHIASAPAICKQTGALLGGPDETMKKLIKEKGLQPEQIVNNGSGYITGGGTELDWCKVIAVPAIHTSDSSIAMGTIFVAKDGTTIYHTGDTSLTAEMEIYARLYPIDILILPIFGQATMDPFQAAEATRLINPKKVMPVHFDFCQDPEAQLQEFIKLCSEKNPDVEIIRSVQGEQICL